MKKPGAGSFQLEPDGFSIHTLGIVKKLSNKEYKRIRDSIYQKCPKGKCTVIGAGKARESAIAANGFGERG